MEGPAVWRFWLKYIFNYRTGARGCFPHSSLCSNRLRASKKTSTQRKQLIIQSVHKRYEQKPNRGRKLQNRRTFNSTESFKTLFFNSFFVLRVIDIVSKIYRIFEDLFLESILSIININ